MHGHPRWCNQPFTIPVSCYSGIHHSSVHGCDTLGKWIVVDCICHVSIMKVLVCVIWIGTTSHLPLEIINIMVLCVSMNGNSRMRVYMLFVDLNVFLWMYLLSFHTICLWFGISFNVLILNLTRNGQWLGISYY